MMSRTGNRILDRLPDHERDLLLASSERIVLPAGHELYRHGSPIANVFFPIEGMWSTVVPMNEGRSVEAGVVGREGMLGLEAYLHVHSSALRSYSQAPGQALRIPASALLQLVPSGGACDRLLRRYSAYVFRTTMRLVACTALHGAKQRICRWLLLAHDHIGVDEFALTHEKVAELLAMRRQTVTTVFGGLKRENIVSSSRGTIRVVDRAALEATACDCYRATQTLYERMMNGNGESS